MQSPVDGAELIVSQEGEAVVRWQTDGSAGQDEAYQFEITATDAAGDEATASVIVVVDNVNQPPEFVDIQLTEAIEGESVAVPLSASDPDDPEEPLTFQLSGDFPPGLAIIAGSDLLIQPQLGQAGKYNLSSSYFRYH